MHWVGCNHGFNYWVFIELIIKWTNTLKRIPERNHHLQDGGAVKWADFAQFQWDMSEGYLGRDFY